MKNKPRRLFIPRGQKFPSKAKAVDRRSDWGNPHIVGPLDVPDPGDNHSFRTHPGPARPDPERLDSGSDKQVPALCASVLTRQ